MVTNMKISVKLLTAKLSTEKKQEAEYVSYDSIYIKVFLKYIAFRQVGKFLKEHL